MGFVVITKWPLTKPVLLTHTLCWELMNFSLICWVGKYFSKLNTSQAYLQLPLDRQYVTVNTPKGYNRLPFGVSSAPSIFQQTMNNLLQGIKGVSIYMDDILISGTTVEEHLQTLDKMGSMRVGWESKCFFLRPWIDHIIDKDGLHPTKEKVRAIQESPTPRNVGELRSFFEFHQLLQQVPTKPVFKISSPLPTAAKGYEVDLGKRATESFRSCQECLTSRLLSCPLRWVQSASSCLRCFPVRSGSSTPISWKMGQFQGP